MLLKSERVCNQHVPTSMSTQARCAHTSPGHSALWWNLPVSLVTFCLWATLSMGRKHLTLSFNAVFIKPKEEATVAGVFHLRKYINHMLHAIPQSPHKNVCKVPSAHPVCGKHPWMPTHSCGGLQSRAGCDSRRWTLRSSCNWM